jgi:hypothetical protein
MFSIKDIMKPYYSSDEDETPKTPIIKKKPEPKVVLKKERKVVLKKEPKPVPVVEPKVVPIEEPKPVPNPEPKPVPEEDVIRKQKPIRRKLKSIMELMEKSKAS